MTSNAILRVQKNASLKVQNYIPGQILSSNVYVYERNYRFNGWGIFKSLIQLNHFCDD